MDLLRALVGVGNVASGPDWQQSAKRLVGNPHHGLTPCVIVDFTFIEVLVCADLAPQVRSKAVERLSCALVFAHNPDERYSKSLSFCTYAASCLKSPVFQSLRLASGSHGPSVAPNTTRSGR